MPGEARTPTPPTTPTTTETTPTGVRMVTPGLHVSPAQAALLSTEFIHTADRMTTLLRGPFGTEEWPEVQTKGLGPDTTTFCDTMAAVRETHGDELGATAPTADSIRTRVQVARNLEPAVQAATRFLAAVHDVWAVNLGTALRGARDVYNRATPVAATNEALSLALQPVRSVRTRVAKKAAATRRRKQAEAAKAKTGEE